MIFLKRLCATILLALTCGYPVQAADLVQWLDQRLYATAPNPTPAFIASFDVEPAHEAFDSANANSAYIYDQALVLMAFLAVGDKIRAKRIGDAFLYAQDHDRFWHDGRLRNAYAAGLVGEGAIKLPGYWDAGANRWQEDGYQAGSATGNNAWAGIALMQLSDATGDKRYAEAARKIALWLMANTADDNPGLKGGFEGFEPHPTALTWRSGEHNTAVLALMRRLAHAYPNQGFDKAVHSAETFLTSLWDGRRFIVGTLPDSVTLNHDYSSFDVQVLSLLALHPSDPTYYEALRYAEQTHGVVNGFDYSDARAGIWAEGTMEAADLYNQIGAKAVADDLIQARKADQGRAGGIYAVSGLNGQPLQSLSTGLALGNGAPDQAILHYYRRVHIAPTAWLIMAEKNYNPLGFVN